MASSLKKPTRSVSSFPQMLHHSWGGRSPSASGSGSPSGGGGAAGSSSSVGGDVDGGIGTLTKPRSRLFSNAKVVGPDEDDGTPSSSSRRSQDSSRRSQESSHSQEGESQSQDTDTEEEEQPAPGQSARADSFVPSAGYMPSPPKAPPKTRGRQMSMDL